MTPARTSLGLWGQLKEAAVPIAAYWALLLFAFGCFVFAVVASAALSGGIGGDDVAALAIIGVVCLGGAALGQLMAFVRVRTWIVVGFGALCWAAAFGLGLAASAGGGGLAAFVFLVLFLLPFSLTGGLWSLETHRGLWATWLPLLLTVGATIGWIEKVTGADANWYAGNKAAIWDPVTLVFLGGSVLLTLVYLVARETHRLALWRRGPTAPLAPTLKEQGAARPRLTLLGCGALMVLAAGLTIGTAIVAPYFWRTGDDGDEPDDTPNEQPAEAPQGEEPDEGQAEWIRRLGEAIQRVAESAQQAGEKAGNALCTMLTVLLLGLLGIAIAWRPLRRLTLVRHLKDPLWEVPATERIDQGWRLVEIALGDAGVHPQPGEDARGLARRARPVLEKLSPVEVHGLEDAAEVADRVRFGLGVHPVDLDVMQRFSAWAMDTVWERLDDLQQLRCMYRRL